MRQKSKQIILMLCMAACLSLLTGCASQSSDSSLMVDPSLAGSISQVSEELLEEISSFTAEDAPYIAEELKQQRQSVLADGVTDWAGVESDTGRFVRAISSEVVMEDPDNYICTIYAEYELRNLEFKIYYEYSYDYQSLIPTALAFNPEYTLGEKMQKAFLNMILGMGLVFIILIFLSLLISCFRFINIAQDKLKGKSRLPEGTGQSVAHADTSVVKRVKAPAVEETFTEETPAPEEHIEAYEPEYVDDYELIAVISAAIAASEDMPADGLVVRSIRRVSGSNWKNS